LRQCPVDRQVYEIAQRLEYGDVAFPTQAEARAVQLGAGRATSNVLWHTWHSTYER